LWNASSAIEGRCWDSPSATPWGRRWNSALRGRSSPSPTWSEAGRSACLCLAESLVERRGFDPVDQLERYLAWYRRGHLSSTGRCFDIGNTVRGALETFEKTRAPYCGPSDPNTAGNGSLMRLAPVPLAFARRPAEAIERAADSSRTTHQAVEAIDACRYLAVLILGALEGVPKHELLAKPYEPVPSLWDREPLAPRMAAIASGSFRRKKPPAIRGSGYVVESLEAALWALDRSETFDDGVLRAVNLGDDADTTGAIYGQLAGTLYGERGIRESWRARLAHYSIIVRLAEALFGLAESPTGPNRPFDVPRS
jgi:ADP-ribosylglycohydrolase